MEPDHGASSAIIEHASPVGFDATVARLTAAIEHAGLVILAHIDHAAGARAAGLAMPPTTVLIYGNAKGGTPIMVAAPKAVLDLPLRVLVREEAGRTLVAYHPSTTLFPVQHLLVKALRPGSQL